MTRARLRDLGITIGRLPTGPYNAITDVSGVLVGHTTIIRDEPRIARTGVTVIVPREGNIWHDNAFAGFHSFNGCGEMTGVHWLKESGLLCSPVAITCTHQVGTAHQALMKYGHKWDKNMVGALPVVAETWDGWLNDAYAFHITEEDVFKAMESALGGVPAEGCVGGGTGMICHDFKGGIGSNGSGDIFLAFATGNHFAGHNESLHEIKMMPHHHMTPLFEAVAEAVEEAILNVLTAAETTKGFKGRTAQAMPLDEVKRIWEKYRPARPLKYRA